MKRLSESDDNPITEEKQLRYSVVKAPSADPRAHDAKFPFFRRPRVIGCFSVDSNRKFLGDRSEMRFFCPEKLKNSSQAGSSYKRVNWDLNEGYDKVVHKDVLFSKDEGLSLMLKCIVDNKSAFQVIDQKTNETAPFNSLSTDFVCFRGLCTTIMCTPYEKREGWQLFAVKHHGTIYLREMPTEAKLKSEANKSEHQTRMCSWGFKFEQYMVDDLRKEREDGFNEHRKLPPVNENEEFCCLFRTRLGSHSVVYGAEMDGFRLRNPSEGPINLDDIDLNQDGHFVELKTSRIIDSPRLEASFARHKIIKWWCQCFLVGIPVVVCGFRNDHGVVSRMTDYPTVKLPSIGSNFWMPNVCMNFLDSFLTFVKGTVQEEDVLFRFWWDPNASEVHVVKPKHQDPSLVLPSWYKEDIFKTE